jgi:2-beta-glucuronyltransferase
MNVFFVSGHDASAGRKVDFHFWADCLERKGIHVDFMTVGLSYATGMKKNSRHFSRPFNTWIRMSDLVQKYVWRPVVHPFSLGNKKLDSITAPVFSIYPSLVPTAVKDRVRQADIVVIESGVGLMLVSLFAKLAPKAKFIYSVSDLLETLTFHPMVLQAEKAALPLFNSIRVPAAVMQESFPASAPITYVPPGLDTEVFDAPASNPFKTSKNAISVGDMLFNPVVIETLAGRFPDWTFHVFGKKSHLTKPFDNVIEHGERPFSDLVPYLLYSDIGLAPYRDAPSVAYISQSSLKMVQYTYCQLPIVAPHFAAAGRDHVQSFHPDADEASLVSAFESAMAYDRNSIDRSQVMNWEKVTEQMFLS